jgi:bacteriocin biosynthesis cyclodehydratase domain-containing protein
MEPTVLFTAGRFGDAVAARLAEYLPLTAVHPLPTGAPGSPASSASSDELDALIGDARFVAAALWRPYPAACDAIDAACARKRIRWVPAVLDHTELCIGPIVDAAAGPCFACFRRRYLTHHEALDRELSLQRAYDRDPALGIPGFCEPMVAIAAAGLAEAAAAPAQANGRFQRVHLLECTVEESRVVPVHGCPRCGVPGPADPHDRYTQHLVPALAGLAELGR